MTVQSNYINYYSQEGVRYVFIDGHTCDTIEKCYITLAEQLSIPDYFGYNLDALEEILADLEWIEEEQIRLIVIHATTLLQLDSDLKNDFIKILMECENERVKVIGL